MKKLIIFAIFSVLILSSCKNETKTVMSHSISTSYENLLDRFEEPFNAKKKVTLSAVGDIMFHRYQLTRAFNNNTLEFDFADSFKYVKPFIESSDFAVANLETTLAGVNGARKIKPDAFFKGFSGYPCFNTPDIAVTNISDAGFDLVTTANNHSLDSKVTGLERTLDILDSNKILHIGTYRSKEEAEKIQIVNIKGIDFAFLSFTYGANGFSLPKEEEYRLNSLEMYDSDKLEKMYAKVRQAYEMDVDEIIVMLHFGNEYVKYPDNYYQKPIVDKLFKSGADVILGSHPHVLQPIEIKNVERYDGKEDTCFVIYSLGNFLSSQQGKKNKDTDIGVICNIEFEQIGYNKPIITGISLIPTYTYWSEETIGIVPINQVIENEEMRDFFKIRDINRMTYAYDNIIRHLTTYLKDYNYEYIDNKYFINLIK